MCLLACVAFLQIVLEARHIALKSAGEQALDLEGPGRCSRLFDTRLERFATVKSKLRLVVGRRPIAGLTVFGASDILKS